MPSIVPLQRLTCLLALCGASGRIPADNPARAFDPTRALARISVTERGIARVARDDLTAAGVLVVDRDPRTLNLYYKGEPIPIHFPGEEDGSFDEGDSFYFWGTYLEGTTTTKGIYSDASAYFIVAGDQTPVRYFRRVTSDETPEAPIGILRTRYHFEPEYPYPFFKRSGAEEADYAFAGLISSGNTDFQRDFGLSNVHSGGGTFALRAKFQGRSELPANPDHQLRLYINGTDAGIAQWDGVTPFLFESKDLPIALIPDGRIHLRIAATGELEAARRFSPGPKDEKGLAAIGFDQVLVDWIQIDYPATSAAVRHQMWERLAGELDLRVEPSLALDEPRVIAVTGVPAEEMLFFDLGHAEILHARTNDRGEARISPWIDSKTHIVGATPERMNRAFSITIPSRVELVASAMSARMVAIGPPELLEAIKPLLAHKESRGLACATANILDVYDQYGFGHKSPAAIRSFLRAVYQTGGQKLRYVLLVGGASQDPKNLGKRQEESLDVVPTFWQPSNLFPPFANDNWYGRMTDESAVPELAVGRIPTRSADEVAQVVRKTINFETSSDTAWKHRILLVGSQESFFRQELESQAKRILAKDPKAEIGKVYAEDFEEDLNKYSNAMIKHLNEGAALMYFAGHGGGNVWRVGPNAPPPPLNNMFDLEDVAGLTNRGRHPIVMAATCYTTTYDFPEANESIGMKLLTVDDAGAVAVTGSSYRCYFNSAARTFAEMIEAMYDADVETIGDAYLETFKLAIDTESRESMAILGDPSLSLATLPRAVTAVSNAETQPDLSGEPAAF